MYLLEEAGVAVVPGSGFLMDGFFRISYASSEKDLQKACENIKAGVQKLIWDCEPIGMPTRSGGKKRA